jgi:hypothetical protein
MLGFIRLIEKVKEDYWTYFAPSWWQFRWRGGKFVIVRVIVNDPSVRNDLHYKTCMAEVVELAARGGVEWAMTSHKQWGNLYEITTVRFLKKSDAMLFKLSWL